MAGQAQRLDLLKALGDNTRYAIYLELARSPRPLSTTDVAESLGLHVNTVRPHLERMREVGLLDARPDASGAVGRPQKLYELAADAPGLGLEPPVFPLLSTMLLQVAVESDADPETVLDAGRRAGSSLAHRRRSAPAPAAADVPGPCAAAAVAMLEELGFDPASATEDGRTVIAFGHCPFADLAESQPQVVCGLHRGILEGLVEEVGDGAVAEFHDLVSRTPCRVTVSEAS